MTQNVTQQKNDTFQRHKSPSTMVIQRLFLLTLVVVSSLLPARCFNICNNKGERQQVCSVFNANRQCFIPSTESALFAGFNNDNNNNRIFQQVSDGIKSVFPPATPKVTAPQNFVVPEPKPLQISRPETLPEVIKQSIPLALRLGTTAFVLGWKIDTLFAPEDGKYSLKLGPLRIRDSSSVLQNVPRPLKKLIIYEYDASPFCQRVREIVNLLDLTVEYRPCPGARQSKFSDDLFKRTGRKTVPYLVDENTGVEMFESTDIINYLVDTYGPQSDTFDRKALWPITFEQFSVTTSGLVASVLDFPASQRQANARPDNELMKPITIYAYEVSPFCKPVRAKLCALSLPHTYVSCSRGSKNRDVLLEKTGNFQVPYIEDPNTGIAMFESNEICEYLDSVYTIN